MQLARLTDEDRSVLERLCDRDRPVEARKDLTHEGDRPENVHLMTEGFACRFKTLPDGRRQIMAVLVPGDLCDQHVAILGAMDDSIAALSPCRVVTVPQTVVHGGAGRAHQ